MSRLAIRGLEWGRRGRQEEMGMGRQHVGQSEIAAFAQEKVNLPKEEAEKLK